MEAARIVKDDNKQWNYMQGEVAIPVDPESILKTIDALEKCNAGIWVTLARHNDLPADPFIKKLLKPVLMGILQNAWYKQFSEGGIVPEKCLLNQETRVKKYLEDLEKAKTNPQGTEATASAREPKTPRTAKSYRLVESKRAEWEKFKGQKKLIIEAMVAMGAVGTSGGASSATIADAIKDKLETKQPAERVVAFYMNSFGHDGIVDSPGDQPSLPVTKTGSEQAAPADTPAKPASPPAEKGSARPGAAKKTAKKK